MYSVVMMAAFAATGPDAVEFHKKWRSAPVEVGCCDTYGGWGYGGHRHGWRWGGDAGYGVYGCYGVVAYGQYGCAGYHAYSSCFGQYGGTACYGGCYGSCLGCIAHTAGCYGGCYGQPIWYGPAQPYHPAGNPMIAPPAAKPADAPPAAKPAGAAKLILNVPAQAKIYVDDMPMAGTDTVRHFRTPELEPGQTYYYTVRVEGTRDGQEISETRRVLVRAGEEFRETFSPTSPNAVVKK
ncbi:MAG: TIGR03000 domain-containing protein [Gemmataceae bacterium]|nr:TIGR03000 domain-containing protein [Gemmataceae bacterium]